MHYLADAQQGSGAWAYGEGRMQQWVDGFHTGYNLSALLTYCRFTGDHSFDSIVARGYQYYVQNFFREDGAPKYFNNAVYPIDIHSCTQAMLTFCDFWNEDASAPQRAVNMAEWTIRNMALPDGSFCYQKHALWTNRTPYMRWGQAWTFRSMARLALQLKTRT
jgi:hypothetical protein